MDKYKSLRAKPRPRTGLNNEFHLLYSFKTVGGGFIYCIETITTSSKIKKQRNMFQIKHKVKPQQKNLNKMEIRHIIIKMSKVKYKEKIFKAARKSNQLQIRRPP